MNSYDYQKSQDHLSYAIKLVQAQKDTQMQQTQVKQMSLATIETLKKYKQFVSQNKLQEVMETENQGKDLFSIFGKDLKVPNPEEDSEQNKTSKSIRRSIHFSDFISPCQNEKTPAILLVHNFIKISESKNMAYSFYRLRKHSNHHREIIQLAPKYQAVQIEQEDHTQQLAKDHNYGILALESRVTFHQKKQGVPRSQKEIQKKVFLLSKQNECLKADVERLKQEIEEVRIRQHKEVSKKQGSLMGLMEELADKNEQIEQLKLMIRQLASKVKIQEKGVLFMLEQDSDSLRRNILRLQHINDRLNNDVDKGRKQIQFLRSQIQLYEDKCSEMKNEIKQLKEDNFDLETNKQVVHIMRREAEVVEKRFFSKFQKVKKLEKRLSLVVKSKDFFNDQENESKIDNHSYLETKATGTQSSHSGLRKTESTVQEQKTEHKLQAVLNYLFNISDENYQIQSSKLFEYEELQLLKQHKELFKKNKIVHSIESPNPKEQVIPGFFDNSLSDILSQKDIATDNRDRERIATLERDCESIRSKVYILKQRELHVRSVVLSLLKTLQLRAIKKEAEHILLLLCELFEYSESERELIFTQKPRKMFSFI